MNDEQEREALLRDMAARLARHMPASGDRPGPMPGMICHRRDASGPLADCMVEPQVLLILQGEKSALMARRRVRCGAGEHLLVHVLLPALHGVARARPDAPFLSLGLNLDQRLIGELLVETPAPRTTGDAQGVAAGRTDLPLLKVFQRLAELLDAPEDAPVLGPLVAKELHYRLLRGPHGNALRQLHTPEARFGRIAESIAWLREHYAEPLVIADLAKRVGLSETALFRRFKRVTTLTPLQYQKHLRLHEAQRLMLAEHLDVSRAAYAVGYASSHQFSREYKRLFGQSPRRDVAGKLT